MLDIDKGSETIDKADGFFTKLNGFIKKHPIWFIVILVGAFCWWASTLPEDVADEVIEQQSTTEIVESAKEHKEEYTITKKTYLVDDYGHRKGDTVYVDYYDDGYVDMYYKTDSKTYYADE
jgi:hypothetical protein